MGSDDHNLKTLGERIRQARKARGLTQESLADKAKIDRSYVGGVERGERNLTGVNLSDVWSDIPPVRHAKHKRRGANALALGASSKGKAIRGPVFFSEDEMVALLSENVVRKRKIEMHREALIERGTQDALGVNEIGCDQ